MNNQNAGLISADPAAKLSDNSAALPGNEGFFRKVVDWFF